MSFFEIVGRRRLSGSLAVQGAKNSVLPILAACILSPGECVIHSCPDLSDVSATLEILRGLGCNVRREADTVIVDASGEACSVIRENIKRTKMEGEISLVRSDYLAFLKSCKQKFDLILLDPPYAEDFLEKSLKMITEIDILQSGGIIIAERPLGKELSLDFPGYTRSKDYKYGKILVTLFRKSEISDHSK